MLNEQTVGVVIPALNEEKAIGGVLAAIPDWVDRIIVVDNGSTDGTADIASKDGATVVSEPNRGYGNACLSGIQAVGNVDLIVFLDADGADDPQQMGSLVEPLTDGRAELVIGSRVLGEVEAGALTPQQRYGNGLACFLMRIIWGASYTDLGPFRAITRAALDRLDMQDRNFGWTVEMQINAARHGLATLEVSVAYRRRIGKSKISGTIRGTISAGAKILFVIGKSALIPRQ